MTVIGASLARLLVRGREPVTTEFSGSGGALPEMAAALGVLGGTGCSYAKVGTVPDTAAKVSAATDPFKPLRKVTCHP